MLTARTLKPIILAIFLALGFIYSCKRDSGQIQKINRSHLSVERIKELYDSLGLSSKLSYHFRDSLTIHWVPNWQNSFEKKLNDTATYYYIPLVPIMSADQSNKSYSTILVGFEDYLVVRSTPGLPCSFQKSRYISMRPPGKGKRINYTDFTGKLVIDNFGGSNNVISYVNGMAQKIKTTGPRTETMICDQECTWSKWCERGPVITVTIGTAGDNCPYPMDGDEVIDCGVQGSSSGWSKTNTDMVNCADGRTDPGPLPTDPGGGQNPGTGGAGSAGGTNIIEKIKTDSIRTPCLLAAINTALNKNLKNEITMAFNDLFSGSDDFDITFLEGDLGTATYGATKAVGRYDIEITLNNRLLPNASNEFIVATIMHEAIHAMYDAKGLTANNKPISFGEYVQHNLMADRYVDDIAAALGDIFPMLIQYDAKALAWGGLQDGVSWKALPPDVANAIVQAEHQYDEDHTKGTRCK